MFQPYANTYFSVLLDLRDRDDLSTRDKIIDPIYSVPCSKVPLKLYTKHISDVSGFLCSVLHCESMEVSMPCIPVNHPSKYFFCRRICPAYHLCFFAEIFSLKGFWSVTVCMLDPAINEGRGQVLGVHGLCQTAVQRGRDTECLQRNCCHTPQRYVRWIFLFCRLWY